MRTTPIITLCASTFLAVPIVGTVSASASASTSAEVPFRATFSGSAEITGPTSTAFFGAGQATHLGRISTEGHVQITGSDNGRCPGGVANTNTEILTAANGDTLTVTSTDVACPAGPGQYHGSGHWIVSGGTGRFAGASGAGSFDGHSDFVAGTFDTTLTGKIS